MSKSQATQHAINSIQNSINYAQRMQASSPNTDQAAHIMNACYMQTLSTIQDYLNQIKDVNHEHS